MSIVMLLVYSMFILASSPCFHLTTKSLLFDYWIIFLEPIVQGRNNVCFVFLATEIYCMHFGLFEIHISLNFYVLNYFSFLVL